MLIRIAGRNIQTKKQLKFALTPVKGIGKSNVKQVIAKVYQTAAQDSKHKLPKTLEDFMKSKFDDLSEELTVIFRNVIENDFLVEADLRRKEQADVRRLIDLGTWRGLRHQAKLPTRGQRTKTNSRTVRGNVRISKGSGRAKSAAKT